MVWYNICTCRAARGLKPINTRSQIRKTAFFRVDSICPWKFQVRLIEWSIPEVFCLVNQICNRVEPPRFFDLRYFTETPQRRLVAIFGTKWGCKLEFGSRSIRSPKVNFLALTIKKWQAWEDFPKMTQKWPNLGFRPITLERRDLGTSNLASWHPLGMIYLEQEQSQKFWILVPVPLVPAVSLIVLIIQ